jgi:hypothetical protein
MRRGGADTARGGGVVGRTQRTQEDDKASWPVQFSHPLHLLVPYSVFTCVPSTLCGTRLIYYINPSLYFRLMLQV